MKIEGARTRTKKDFFIKTQRDYTEFTEVTVFPPSFDWNENLVLDTLHFYCRN
jgi:hypothetical protein